MGALVSTAGGQEVPVQMGSYGIGVSRLVGAIIEASHDANGIVWPEPVAPFKVGLVNIRTGDATCERACEDIFTRLRRSEEHTSELQSLMRISYAVFCLQKKHKITNTNHPKI